MTARIIDGRAVARKLRAGAAFRIGRGESFGVPNPGAGLTVSLWVIAPPRH